jgi:hypothetical protein
MRRELKIVATTGALFLGLVSVSPVAAAPPVKAQSAIEPAAGFGSPTEVITGQFHEISEVVDSTNRVHIAAVGRHGLWYITDRGGTWSRTRILLDVPNHSWFEPSIALDGNDRVYISVAQNVCDDCAPGGSTGIYYLTDKGRARGTFPASPTRIAPEGSGQGTIKVSNGHLFVSYVRRCCQPGPLPKVLLRTNATGSWTTTQVSPHGDLPSLRIGSDGRPRIAFSRGGGIFYAVASSPAGSFTKQQVPGTSNLDSGVRLALDAGNHPHIVWFHGFSTSSLRYAARQSGGWQGPSVVDSNAGFGAMAFDLDSLGRPNVAFGQTHIRNKVLFGGLWHKTAVASGLDVISLAERRAFSGSVVIAWSDSNGGIWVSRN